MNEQYQLCRLPVSPGIIHRAIWLYLRFTLSFHDVADLLAERGIAVSYETIRLLRDHSALGDLFRADDSGGLTPAPTKAPHDLASGREVYLKIDGRMACLWRVVDAEGEVLDLPVQAKRNKHAAEDTRLCSRSNYHR